jgi:hypothetical protein
MKARSKAHTLTVELENDLACAMLIERRHAEKIGTRQARELIERIKHALTEGSPEAADQLTQDLISGFPVH